MTTSPQSIPVSPRPPRGWMPWVWAARPKTLPAAMAPVAAGTALGGRLAGGLDWGLAWWALASCLALQIATNLFNDALDHRRGADTSARLGPRRITAAGDRSPAQVLAVACIFLLGAGLLALPLLQARGWVIVAIGLPSLILCYGYTGEPLALAYRGLGDLFVLVFFGWVAVGGSVFLQTGTLELEGILLGTQIGLWSTALIAINNLRDVEEDRYTGKKTLAVRWGAGWAKGEIIFCLLGPSLIGLAWLAWGYEGAAFWPLVTLPLGGSLALKVWRTAPSARYNGYLAWSALHLLMGAGLLTWALA